MKKLFALLLVVLLIYPLQLSIRMLHSPTIIANVDGAYNQDLYAQLQFLKTKMQNGAGIEMQALYPEGLVFLHALYALSWANLVENTNDSKLLEEAAHEMAWTIARLESHHARSIFPKDMKLPYGVFYQGWINYTRSRYLGISSPTVTRDTLQQQRFVQACIKIAEAVEYHHTPFLFSYHGGAWPADNVVALAALAEHDRLFEPRFEQIRLKWLMAIKTRVDSQGLIPHEVDLTYGNSSIDALGSSQSLMLAFWPRIDSIFAQQQFQIYKKRFVDERLGLPGIREYPRGKIGRGHIDSGPVIWDIGGAASLVGMGTVAQYGDACLHQGLRNSIEGFGWAITFGNKKRYLFGQLPIADAFIAWSHSRVPLPIHNISVSLPGKFLLMIGTLILLLTLTIWKLLHKKSA